jgi:hypothetical protein
MSSGIDILHLFPELAAIGQEQLQLYCDEWLRRPIAREYALAQIMVDDRLLLYISVDTTGPIMHGDRAFIPIDQLLDYIIDRHFQPSNKRRGLHASVRGDAAAVGRARPRLRNRGQSNGNALVHV